MQRCRGSSLARSEVGVGATVSKSLSPYDGITLACKGVVFESPASHRVLGLHPHLRGRNDATTGNKADALQVVQRIPTSSHSESINRQSIGAIPHIPTSGPGIPRHRQSRDIAFHSLANSWQQVWIVRADEFLGMRSMMSV